MLGISSQEVIHIAVLYESLKLDELVEASRIVRQKWPRAKIIVIRSGKGFLEDFLYDSCVFPTAGHKELLAQIELALHEESGGDVEVSSRMEEQVDGRDEG